MKKARKSKTMPAKPKRAYHKRAMLTVGDVDESLPRNSEFDSRKGCLDTASKAVLGDRQLNYGTAESNFSRIAHLWNAYLETRNTGRSNEAVNPMHRGAFVSSHDVAAMNILLKLARLANTPNHADSWADIAGYAACGAAVNGAKYED